jgi:MobA-like NTP transferase domain
MVRDLPIGVSVKPTLLILAAGRGSRFGGPKQLTPVGPSQEPLLAYTIHDAARAGFGRVVLVCPPTLGADMAARFLACTGAIIEISAVEQTTTDGRSTPWGTGHAVLQARNALGSAPFGVANGDDWYGPDALATLARTLQENGRTRHVLITYALAQTLAFTEGVSRGSCEIRAGDLQGDLPGNLLGVREIFDVRRGTPTYSGHLADGNPIDLPPDAPVSMNLWGFVPPFLESLEGSWRAFRAARPGTEFLLPHAVTELIDSGEVRVETTPSSERPFGLTRPEDLMAVRQQIAGYVATGHYPADLRTGIAPRPKP